MRIIAGEFRGRNLLAPEGDATRPITDRVKQSLFDIVTPLLPGSRVYDCFAGTGSMGLESLSRGAAEAVFFEMDRSALKLLKQNIGALKVEKQSRVVSIDIFKWFEAKPETRNPKPESNPKAEIRNPKSIDLIFLDPPYRFLRERVVDLHTLANQMTRNHLAAAGTIVFRHDIGDSLELPGLVRYDQRDYGGMRLEFLRPAVTG